MKQHWSRNPAHLIDFVMAVAVKRLTVVRRKGKLKELPETKMVDTK